MDAQNSNENSHSSKTDVDMEEKRVLITTNNSRRKPSRTVKRKLPNKNDNVKTKSSDPKPVERPRISKQQKLNGSALTSDNKITEEDDHSITESNQASSITKNENEVVEENYENDYSVAPEPVRSDIVENIMNKFTANNFTKEYILPLLSTEQQLHAISAISTFRPDKKPKEFYEINIKGLKLTWTQVLEALYIRFNFSANISNKLIEGLNLSHQRKKYNCFYKEVINFSQPKHKLGQIDQMNTLYKHANLVKVDLKMCAVNVLQISELLTKFTILLHALKVMKYMKKCLTVLQNIPTLKLKNFPKENIKNIENLRACIINDLKQDVKIRKKDLTEGLSLLLVFVQNLLYGKFVYDIQENIASDYLENLNKWMLTQLDEITSGEVFINFCEVENTRCDLDPNCVPDVFEEIYEKICKNSYDVRKYRLEKTGVFYSVPKVPVYKMLSNPRGYYLMINNVNFTKDKPRHGSEVDQQDMWNVFNEMGFVLHGEVNLRKEDMKNLFQKTRSDPLLKDVDCFVCVIMSHGRSGKSTEESHIVTTCGESFSIKDIVDQFNNINCPNLQKKPKIFIFQSCRGDEKDKGLSQDSINEQEDFGTPTSKIRRVTDILIAYATSPGYVSIRDKNRGSWFIQTLCDIFSKHAHDTHVEDLLKLVGEEFDGIEAKAIKAMQTPCTEQYAFKTCFLNPGVIS